MYNSYDEKLGKLVGVKDNWNLNNFILRVRGPMSEEQLARLLVKLQLFSCVFGLILRYYVASYVFGLK